MNLDRRINIKKKTATINSYGEEVITYVNHATVWAKKEDLSSTERLIAAQLQGQIDTKFIIRFRNDIEPTMIIVHDGTEYKIEPPKEIGRKEYIEIGAKANV